jgi:HEPN domain-containing protein
MSVQNEPDPRQWPEAVRWLSRADDDLRIIHLALNVVDPPLFGAALHCQQATEKMAKAVLIAFGVMPPKIHDIERLGRQVSALHADIGNAVLDLASLTAWYVASRYADAASELAPSAQDIAAVLGKLHELRRRIETLRPSGTE